MAVKITERKDSFIIDVGPDVRVERTFAPETDEHGNTRLDDKGQPIYKWKIYEAVHTGVEYHEEHAKELKAGRGRNADGVVPHHAVKKLGKHPVINDEKGNPIPTSEEFIWVPADEATSKEEALEVAKRLAAG